MDWTNLIIAGIGALSSFLAVYISNRKSSALMAYRIEQLEKKVDRHNNVIDRTYRLEENLAVIENRVDNIERRGA